MQDGDRLEMGGGEMVELEVARWRGAQPVFSMDDDTPGTGVTYDVRRDWNAPFQVGRSVDAS